MQCARSICTTNDLASIWTALADRASAASDLVVFVVAIPIVRILQDCVFDPDAIIHGYPASPLLALRVISLRCKICRLLD